MRLLLVPISIVACFTILWAAKPVLVPILLAVLLAQLLSPVVSRFERRIPGFLAVLLTLTLMVAIVLSVVALVGTQLSAFETNLPLMAERVSKILDSAAAQLGDALGIIAYKPTGILKQSFEGTLSTASGSAAAFSAVTFTVMTLAETALVLILTFLMLYYRRHFRRHIRRLGDRSGHTSIGVALDRTAELGQSYVAGLGTVMLIVGVADTIGFLVVGAPFAALFGLLGALSVLVPYVGIAVTAPLCAALAWMETGSPGIAGGVLAVFGVIHLLEGNIISPWLVGSKVDLNPLATIVAVLIGGQLWGPAGMVLFIPLAGIVKLALDVLPGGEPISRLLGPITSEDIQVKRRPRIRRLLPRIKKEEVPL